jgi:glycosyltransferase involved in cell wall biosynthesis
MVNDQGDSRTTLRPTNGSGVIAVNLIKGLLARRETIAVTVVCLEEGRADLEAAIGTGEKVRIFAQANDGKICAEARKEIIKETGLFTSTSRKITFGMSKLSQVVQRYYVIRRPRSLLQLLTHHLGKLPGRVLFAVLLPLFALHYVLETYISATKKIISRFTSPFIQAIQRRGIEWLEPLPVLREQLHQFARRSDCDFWYIPGACSIFPKDIPTVVLSDDLQTAHDSQCRSATNEVVSTFRLGAANVARTQLVLTTSDCTKQIDLVGRMGLQGPKVRVLPLAWPMLAAPTARPRSEVEHCGRREFLFYPATIQPRKNIHRLIIALSQLRQRFNHPDLGLVLTNPGSPASLSPLLVLIEALELSDHVKFLGSVERGDVAWLYRRAALTVIPNLHASRGCQLYEAVEAACPVVFSRLPLLIERATGLGIEGPLFDPCDCDDMARTIHEALLDRNNLLQKQLRSAHLATRRDWNETATELVLIGAEATALFHASDKQEPASASRACHSGDPLRIFLMLQNACQGGVWIAAKELIVNLVAVNQTRQELDLTVAFHPQQQGGADLRHLVRVETLQQGIGTARETRQFANLDSLAVSSAELKSASHFQVIGNLSALQADAWFALLDRFNAPLLPDRPYGVVVHDMIQVHVPEAFAEDFFQIYREGMIPTLRHADIVMTTSPVTRADVMKNLGIAGGTVGLVPVCFEMNRRFEGIDPEPVILPNRSFILNMNNSSKHKGIEVMLRGHAKLCQTLGSAAPLLVVAGPHADNYSSRFLGKRVVSNSHLEAVHELVKQLQLREGIDIVFLGFLHDAQLLWLYQNCRLIVNSAKYDNGSYNLIEGHYYGKPTVSSRYPAAEWLYERFKVPVRFFPIDDAAALATRMREAIESTQVDANSAHPTFNDPEVGSALYAERVYNLLVQLGKKGRSQLQGQQFLQHPGRPIRHLLSA